MIVFKITSILLFRSILYMKYRELGKQPGGVISVWSALLRVITPPPSSDVKGNNVKEISFWWFRKDI